MLAPPKSPQKLHRKALATLPSTSDGRTREYVNLCKVGFFINAIKKWVMLWFNVDERADAGTDL